MSISGRHRSPLLRQIPDLPKKFLQFSERCPAGRRSFCSSSFEVIYQLYPTANVFCAIDISVYKTAILSLFSHVVYNIIPSISQKVTKPLQFKRFCHTLSARFYAIYPIMQIAYFFAPSLFISAMPSNRCKSLEQYLFVFCPYHFNLHLSFSHPFCYHICIQRALCRKARSMFFDLLGGEQQ